RNSGRTMSRDACATGMRSEKVTWRGTRIGCCAAKPAIGCNEERMRMRTWAAGLVAMGALVACGSTHGGESSLVSDPSAPSLASRDDPIAPIDAPVGLAPRRVALGEKLFLDPILSGDGKVACTSCHHTELGGADGRDHSKLDVRAKATMFNAPSI